MNESNLKLDKMNGGKTRNIIGIEKREEIQIPWINQPQQKKTKEI